MDIQLREGQVVQAENGLIGEVISYGESWWEHPYSVKYENGHIIWYTSKGHTKEVPTQEGYTIKKILTSMEALERLTTKDLLYKKWLIEYDLKVFKKGLEEFEKVCYYLDEYITFNEETEALENRIVEAIAELKDKLEVVNIVLDNRKPKSNN